ncbi:hypothetical protein F3K39_05980 [Streptomyces sp. LBUM 1479]|nr:hypothetical protein [Streptomyces sp. LBUM 1479]
MGPYGIAIGPSGGPAVQAAPAHSAPPAPSSTCSTGKDLRVVAHTLAAASGTDTGTGRRQDPGRSHPAGADVRRGFAGRDGDSERTDGSAGSYGGGGRNRRRARVHVRTRCGAGIRAGGAARGGAEDGDGDGDGDGDSGGGWGGGWGGGAARP